MKVAICNKMLGDKNPQIKNKQAENSQPSRNLEVRNQKLVLKDFNFLRPFRFVSKSSER